MDRPDGRILMTDSDRRSRYRLCWAAAVFVPLAVMVFYLCGAFSIPRDHHYLGLVHSDQLVYYACGRELFENGNGLFYASPFSNQPGSPRVYTHLGFMFFGYLWKAGIPFPVLDHLLRWLLGAGMFALVFKLFEATLPHRRLLGWAAVGAMVLSGVAWMVGLLQLVQARLFDGHWPETLGAWWEDFLFFFSDIQSGYAGWNLNLIGNLGASQELFYHILFFAAVLFTARRRGGWGLFFLLLAWWAHPFTGVQLGAILGAYWLVETILRRRGAARSLAIAIAINVFFLAYNLIFLNRFAEHRASATKQHEKKNSGRNR